MFIMHTERLPFYLSKWYVLTHIIPFPGSVLPSSAINTSSHYIPLSVDVIRLPPCIHWTTVGSLVTGQGTRYAHILSLHVMASLTVCF